MHFLCVRQSVRGGGGYYADCPFCSGDRLAGAGGIAMEGLSLWYCARWDLGVRVGGGGVITVTVFSVRVTSSEEQGLIIIMVTVLCARGRLTGWMGYQYEACPLYSPDRLSRGRGLSLR